MGLFGIILLLIVLGALLIAFYQLKRMTQKYQLKMRSGSNKYRCQSGEKQNLVKLQTSFLNQTKSILDNSGLDSKFSSKGFIQTYSIFRLQLSNCHTIHQMARGDYAYPMDMFNRTVVYQILILQIVSSISIGLLVINGADLTGFIITCIVMTIVFMLINYSCRYIHLYYKQKKKKVNGGVFNVSLTGSQTSFYQGKQTPLPQSVKNESNDQSSLIIEIQNEPDLVKQMEQGQKVNYLKLYRILFFLLAQIFFSVICINQLAWTDEIYVVNAFFFLFILIIADFFLIRPILIAFIVWFKLIWIGCFKKQLITPILEKHFKEMKMEQEMLDYRKKNNKFKKAVKLSSWLSRKSKLDQLNEEEEEESILKDELDLEEEERFKYEKDNEDLQTELENAVDNQYRTIEDQIQKLRNKKNLTEEEQKRLNELEEKLQKMKDDQQQKLVSNIEQNMKEQMELQEEIYKLRNKKKLTEEEKKRLNELEQKLEQKQREEQQMIQQYKNEQLKQKIERESEIQKLKQKMKKEGLNDQELKRLNWLEKQQILGNLNDNKMEQLKIQQEMNLLKLKKKKGKLTVEEQERLNELESQLKQKQKDEQELNNKLNWKEQEIKRHDIEMQKKQKIQEQMELEDEIQRLRNKGDLTEEEQKRLNELERKLEQNKREQRQLDVMGAEQKKEEYQIRQNTLNKRLEQNMKEQMGMQDEINKLRKKKNLTEEEQKRLNELEEKLEQKQKEQKVIQDMLGLLEQQKQTEVMRVNNRKEIEQLEEQIQKLRNKGNLTEQEQKKLNELQNKLEQKLDLDQQLIKKQKEQEQKMKGLEEKLEQEDQKKVLRNKRKELEREQEKIRELQRIEKNKIKALELEEIELQDEIQRLRNKGDLTEEEQKRLNELESRLKEVQKQKLQCQQRLQQLYQQQQENQREQEYLKKQNSRIDEVSDEESDYDQEDESDDNDSYERYKQYQYDGQQDFEMSDEDSLQDQNVYLENNSNDHSLQTQNSNDKTQFNKQSKTLLRSIIQLNDSGEQEQENKTNFLEQVRESEQRDQNSVKDDLSQSQIKTNFNKELKFNMSLSMDQNSIINPIENDVKDQQLGSEQENQSDSQILQLNKIFQNNDKGNSKTNSLNTRNISFSSKANLQGLEKNHNYLGSQKDQRKSANGFNKKVNRKKTKGNKGENQILVKTSTQMDIRKKGVEYSLDQEDLYDNFQKLDFNEIEKMFDKKGKKKDQSNSQMKMGKKFRYIDQTKFGEQMQKKYQDKGQMMNMIYNEDSKDISQQSIINKPLKKLKTYKKEKQIKQPSMKQKIDKEDIHNFDYEAFLKQQGMDALQIKKDQIKIRQPPKTVEKSKSKKKKKKEKKLPPPPKISNGKSPYQEYLPKLIDKQVKEQKIKEKEQKQNLTKLMMSKNNDASMIANQQKINKVTSIYQNQNQSVIFDGNKSILINQSNYGLSPNKVFKGDLLSSIKKQNVQLIQED